MLKKKKKLIICLSSLFTISATLIGSLVAIKQLNNPTSDDIIFDDSYSPVITNNDTHHNIRMRNVGDTLTINATITPDDASIQNITWEFVEEEVEGKLTIVSTSGLSCTIRKEANYAGYYTLNKRTLTSSYADIEQIVLVTNNQSLTQLEKDSYKKPYGIAYLKESSFYDENKTVILCVARVFSDYYGIIDESGQYIFDALYERVIL